MLTDDELREHVRDLIYWIARGDIKMFQINEQWMLHYNNAYYKVTDRLKEEIDKEVRYAKMVNSLLMDDPNG